MNSNLVPFNLDLLVINDQVAKTMLPITDLHIFEGSSKNFHPGGLFSVDIFGRVGDERRNKTYSYINFRVNVLHPLIFEIYGQLKSLYTDIMLSKAYAVWNKDIGDFEKSTPTLGETGYSFFISHFNDIKLIPNDSPKREFNIKLINKYKDKLLMSRLLVMPAGLRDFEVDESGKPTEDEINTKYRKVISLSNLIDTSSRNYESSSYDSIRASLQTAIYDIYLYVKDLLEGKHKLILGKWASRRITTGTRNVITALASDTSVLNGPKSVDYNDTVVGLYQYIKSTTPMSIYDLRSGFLSKVFVGPNSPAVLVNKKTLKKELVHVNPDVFDEWMTSEGLEKMINKFGIEDLRRIILEAEGHYIGLIYRDDTSYKLFQDIDDLPEHLDRKYVFPLTFVELLYLSVFMKSKLVSGFTTRYPITGFGSIYPSKIYLKTTLPSLIKTALDDEWKPSEIVANEFPSDDGQFVNSMSPSTQHLGRLGADFDGDKMSLNIVMTDEAQEEINKYLKSRDYYVGVSGKMNFSADVDIIKYVLGNITE